MNWLESPKAVRYLLYAQLSFFGFLLIAIFMTPEAFDNNHGLSYYGEHVATAIPYGLGFLLAGFFLTKAASTLPTNPQPFKVLAKGIEVVVILMIAVFLTPDTISTFFNWAHYIAAASLFIVELGLAIWLVVGWQRDWLVVGLLAIQFMAGITAMLSQLHVIYYLSEGILLFQLAFGLLLIHEVGLLLQRPGLK